MHRILFSIGTWEIHTYGLMVMLAYASAIFWVRSHAAAYGLTSDRATDLAFWVVIGAIIGGRIFYVFTDVTYYLSHPLQAVFQRSGFVFYGGFIGSSIALGYTVYRWKLNAWATGDLFCAALILGQSIGRLGCFSEGCCYGKPTTSFLGVVFPRGSQPYQAFGGLPVHPVQLYESLGCFLIFIFLMILSKKLPPRDSKKLWKHGSGLIMISYIFLYAVLRFNLEFFRGDFRGSYIGGILSPSQFVALIAVVTAIGLFFLRKKRYTIDPE